MTNSWTQWLLLAMFENAHPGHSADPSQYATVAAIADIETALLGTAAAADPVGHGTIRLRGRSEQSQPLRHLAGGSAEVAVAAEPRGLRAAAVAVPRWAGHGAIRLLWHSPRTSPGLTATAPEPYPAAGTGRTLQIA